MIAVCLAGTPKGIGSLSDEECSQNYFSLPSSMVVIGGVERERNERQFRSVEDFKRRIVISKEELRTLAELGALNCFAKHLFHRLFLLRTSHTRLARFGRSGLRQSHAPSPSTPTSASLRLRFTRASDEYAQPRLIRGRAALRCTSDMTSIAQNAATACRILIITR